MNFNAGPAAMPLAVLERMQAELLDYQGRGLSVLEMSHRSAEFLDIAHRAQVSLRQLLNIPDHYHVLFMQGGARSQFHLSAQNLDCHGKVAFVDSGYWASLAMRAVSETTDVQTVATVDRQAETLHLPSPATWQLPSTASYLHYTANETIDGIALHDIPAVALPLVCDMSSSILSAPVDVTQFAMIYAGAQKNIGPAGITVVILSDDMLERSRHSAAVDVFNYARVADAGSMLNTPPTFAWYCAGLVFDWLLEQGGLTAMATRNKQQAARVYAAIDAEEIYSNRVQPEYRSWMNVPFTFSDSAMLEPFLAGAARRGLVGLNGHKSVGGARASIYNATPDTAIDSLVDYLNDFAKGC